MQAVSAEDDLLRGAANQPAHRSTEPSQLPYIRTIDGDLHLKSFKGRLRWYMFSIRATSEKGSIPTRPRLTQGIAAS